MIMRKIRGGVAVVLGLGLGLVSCEKEVAKGEIMIRFALGDGAYEAAEMRGFEGDRMAAETVVAHVEGEVYLYATLEEEMGDIGDIGTIGTGAIGTGAMGAMGAVGAVGAGLRAAGDETMGIGTRLVIAAYDDNGDWAADAEYEVTDTNGGIKPTSQGISITTEGNYTFVAYSLNETAALAYSASAGPYSPENAGDDPLWGSSAKVYVSAGMNRVTIEMRHAFSKVTLKVSSTDLAGGPVISSLSAALVGYEALIVNGALGKGADLEQEFVFPEFDLSGIVSEQRIVYAGNENVTVIKFSSVEIGGTTRPTLMGYFDKKLLPGRSYILRVAFDELVWAASNIYWDSAAGRLTFDRDITETPYNQGYQGVYFRWGSLVGISVTASFSGTTPLYVPYGYPDNPRWKETSGNSVAGDSDIPYASNWAWGGIPYMDTQSINDLTGAERNDVTTYQGLRGDICQYLSMKTGVVAGRYRMPILAELGVNNTTSWNGRTDDWKYGGTFSNNTNSVRCVKN
jgi:hypothetical protein